MLIKDSSHLDTHNFRLGIVCNVFGHSGGMEMSAIELVDGLYQLGISPFIITKKVVRDTPEKAFIAGLKQIPCKWLPSSYRDLYFAKQVQKEKERLKLDVLIGCCRCPGVDIVVCGGSHPGYVKTKKKPTLLDRVIINTEKKQYDTAKVVVAHSKRVAEEIKQYYPESHALIEVVYPPLELSDRPYIPRDKQQKKELGLPEDKLLFLFVSSSHERKGFGLLEKFFNETKLPVVLGVCGKPLPRNDYKNIFYLGYHRDLSKYYQIADFTILASFYEPYGRVPIESLVCHTPVITSDVLGSNEVISDGCKIEFKSGNYESFCSAMELAVAQVESYQQEASKSLKFLISSAPPSDRVESARIFIHYINDILSGRKL